MTQNEKTLAIIKKVADKHDVSLRDIFGNNRARHLAAARQEAYYEVYTQRGLNMSQTARVFGRDHTTIRHGLFIHTFRLDEQGRKNLAGATEGLVA